MAQVTVGTARFEPHPLRAAVLGEFHARPFPLVSAPAVFLHLAFEAPPGASAEADRARLAALCRAQGAPPPAADARHHVLPFGGGTLRWERHAEFVTYGWQGPLPADARPFGDLPGTHPFGAEFVPPGPLLMAVRLDLLPAEGAIGPYLDVFDPVSLSVVSVQDGDAVAATDFRLDGDGRTRILVLDKGLAPNRAGALTQRLIEVETYRTLAMLGLPEAQRLAPDVRRIELRLAEIASSSRATEGIAANQALLAELTRLTAELEAGAVASSYRFGASRAYYDIVNDRLKAVREERLPGYGSWTGFLARRIGPAMRTINSVSERQADLAEKLGRAAQLLRTRVDVELESQNRDLLESMNRRARMQLRLQQTVEGLSVAAVSYYVVGLVGYLLKAAKDAGVLAVDPAVATGFAVPVVVASVYLMVRRIRAVHAKDA